MKKISSENKSVGEELRKKLMGRKEGFAVKGPTEKDEKRKGNKKI
jgi:hypothetical protein